jgi:hypothetical protein
VVLPEGRVWSGFSDDTTGTEQSVSHVHTYLLDDD